MKIGITGGSGFIGQYLLEKIKKSVSEKHITILDKDIPTFQGDFNFIHGDIRNEIIVDKFCCDLDIVYHFAAAHTDFGISHEEYFDVNQRGTKNIITKMIKYDVRNILFLSTVAVYGKNNNKATEYSEPSPITSYGLSKLAAEEEIKKWCKNEGGRAIIIRPTVVIGPRNTANTFKLINQISNGNYMFNLGKGDNIKSMAYVENLVDFCLYLINKNFHDIKEYEIFNYIDYPQLSIRKTIEIIHEEFNKLMPKIDFPKWLAVVVGKVFDLKRYIVKKDLPISSSRVKKLCMQTRFEAKKCYEWGFTPTFTLEQGLRNMVKWYIESVK